ncbi:hypothetical protein BC832DRAFT_564012 [Gaertneriomyces semiglobifer]|nr:hypothetical protein BC832DRAFT_564012 [Gaertneriomyces semiglobifer]
MPPSSSSTSSSSRVSVSPIRRLAHFLQRLPTKPTLIVLVLFLILRALLTSRLSRLFSRPRPRPSSSTHLKKPRHIAVLYKPHENVRAEKHVMEWIENVGRVVKWCLDSGVGWLTVWDPEGVLVRNTLRIREELRLLGVEGRVRFGPSTASTAYHDDAFDEPNATTRSVVATRISKDDSTCELEIYIASSTGRSQLASFIHEFLPTSDATPAVIPTVTTTTHTTTKTTKPALSDPLTVDAVMRYMDSRLSPHPYSDPQLVFVTRSPRSNVLELGDFMPWNLRLSEFHMVSEGVVRKREFERGMEMFGRCQQRFGT